MPDQLQIGRLLVTIPDGAPTCATHRIPIVDRRCSACDTSTCADCGLDFRIDGGPEDRTHMPDGRTLCAACALCAGVPEAF